VHVEIHGMIFFLLDLFFICLSQNGSMNKKYDEIIYIFLYNNHSRFRITLLKLIFSFFKYLKFCLKTIFVWKPENSNYFKIINVFTLIMNSVIWLLFLYLFFNLLKFLFFFLLACQVSSVDNLSESVVPQIVPLGLST
jgi:hypothetical protein